MIFPSGFSGGTLEVFLSTQKLHMTIWCAMILTPGHFAYSRALEGNGQNLCTFFFSLYGKRALKVLNLHTLRFLITRGCVMNLTQGQVCNVKGH